jgi:hypothetical protein
MLRRVAAGTSPCGRRKAGPTGGACPPGSRPAAGGAGGFNAAQKLRTKLSDHMPVTRLPATKRRTMAPMSTRILDGWSR